MSACPTCGPIPSADLLGIEVRGVFDGVLIWQCPAGHQWPRFQPEGGYSRLHDKAVEIIAAGSWR